MKCETCGKQHMGLSGLLFAPAPKREGYTGPCHRAVCKDCSRKEPKEKKVKQTIAIDHRVTEDKEYPF